jgi:hypothetical protein
MILESIVFLPAAALVAVIGGAVRSLRRQRRAEQPEYAGRHRAELLSTMERNAVRAARARTVIAATRAGHVLVLTDRGTRLPRPRAPLSPWGTPELVDEWTAEHEAVPAS